MSVYDFIVIGSGPAGKRAAVQAAKLGKSVLVVEKGRKVGQMAGTYEQKAASNTAGTLVFTPDAAKTHVTQAHGAAEVETDQYSLAGNGQVLRLTPESGAAMEFHKQSK